MADHLSNLESFLPPPPALCSLVVEQGSLCSSGSDSGFGSPMTPSEALASSDDDEDYLAELTRQMANDMLREKNDDGRRRFTPGSVPASLSNRDSNLRSSSDSSYCNKKADESWQLKNSAAEGDSIRDTQPASEGGNPPLCSYQTLQSKKIPKQANPARRKTHTKNNQWRTRNGLGQGDYYVSLSMARPQKAAISDEKSVFLGGHPKSSGTGVFLPQTSVTPTEEGMNPRCSTVLIPARVAQALMVHFSKHRPRSSCPSTSDPSLRCGPGSDFQHEVQADPEPAVINCNEMGLPQEWIY